MNRVELHLGPGRHEGYLRTSDGLAPLPVGSTLDRDSGVFTWAPGVGFVGAYDLVFVRHVDAAVARREVRIILAPKGSGSVGPQVVIDTPRSQQDVGQPFVLAGWAADLDAPQARASRRCTRGRIHSQVARRCFSARQRTAARGRMLPRYTARSSSSPGSASRARAGARPLRSRGLRMEYGAADFAPGKSRARDCALGVRGEGPSSHYRPSTCFACLLCRMTWAVAHSPT